MQTGEYQGFASRFPHCVRRGLARWAWPLGISLFVHALWLWPAAPPIVDAMGQRGGASLQAELRRPLASALPEPPASVSRPDRSRAAPVVLPQRVLAAPAAHVRTALPPSVPGPAAVQSAPLAVTAPDAAGGSGARIGAPTVPLIASRGLDAGAVRAYRIGLARQLAGLRDRLQMAAAAHADAQAKIAIAVDAGGFVERVEVVESSGRAALDAQLQAAVREAVDAAPVPAALQGQAFVIVLALELGAP